VRREAGAGGTAEQAVRNNFLAIAAMVAATFFYLAGDSIVKLVSEEIPVSQIIVLRGLFTSILIAFAAALTGALRDWRRAVDRPILARSMFDGVTTLLIINALAHMAIADATAVINSVPIVATVLAVFVLKEHVGIRRWAAVITGFIGVLLVLRPSGTDFNAYGLLAFASTLTIAGRDIVTRHIEADVPSLVVTLASAIFVTLTGAVAALVTGGWGDASTEVLAMIAVASMALFGAYHFSVVAIRLGEVSLTAPFRYTVILWGLLVGFVVWGDVPGIMEVSGMALITLCGLYVVHRERMARREARR
jgi:drug/metabolite transporter (DMT)-like permease